MSGRAFTSAFAGDLEAYLAFKQNMGHCDTARVWYLRQFDTWCAEHDRTVFDQATVEGWVAAELERSGRRSWMSYIRDFGRWLQAGRSGDAYVLSGRWIAPRVPPRPYLLSSWQIERFFAGAAALKSKSPWRWQAVAFFTLMHSCGLRTGEVRSLQPRQVNLDDGHVDIVWSKGNRSRTLPLTTEVSGALAACDRALSAHFPSRGTFFVSAAGNQVTPESAGKAFARIWDEAGLARPPGGRQPRPYSFRHHFAYACLERWRRQGKDVTAMLPYLSRYMGHATFESTYYYIHTSPDFLAGYDQITREQSQSLLPEVGFG
jgi:integrase